MSENGLNGERAIVLPRWFIWATGALFAVIALLSPFVISWAGWLTLTMVRVDVRVEDLSTLKPAFTQHIGDPTVHRPALNLIEKRLDVHDEDIDELEARVP